MRKVWLAGVSALVLSVVLAACGGGGGGGPTPPTDNGGNGGVTGPFVLTVSKQGGGFISSSPGGIECGGDCGEAFAAGTTVTLTASPAAGQQFGGWSGDCSGSGTSCVLSMSAARSVQAIFTAPPAAGWQDQVLVSTPATFEHEAPRVAMAADGSALSVWLQSFKDPLGELLGYIVWYSRYTPGAGWSLPQEATRISPYTQTLGHRLAMNDAGKAVFVWGVGSPQFQTPSYTVNAMSFEPSTGWGATATISSETSAADLIFMHAGVDSAGNAVVAWNQLKPGTVLAGRGVWANRLSAGNWSGPQIINNDRDDGAGRSSLAVLPNGDAVMAWTGSAASGVGAIRTAKYSASGSWAAPQDTVLRDGTRFLFGANVTLAAGGNGQALLAWYQIDSIGSPAVLQRAIWTLRYSGGAWGTTPQAASPVLTGAPNDAELQVIPHAALNAQGQAALAWIYTTDTTKMWANRGRSDGTWETAQVLNTGANPDVFHQRIGIDGQGNVTAAWFDTRLANIMTSRYTAATGWSAQQSMANYDPTKGGLAMADMAVNGAGNVVLAYPMNTDAFRQGSQIFSRYFIP